MEHDRAADAACVEEPDDDTVTEDASPQLDDAVTDTDTSQTRDIAGDEDESPIDVRGELRPESRKGQPAKVIRWAAAAVLAVTLAGTGYEGWLIYQHHQQQIAAAQALDAAKKYILALTSIDTNAIDKNFAEVLDGSTGEFKDMYTKSSAQLRQALIDNKAAAHGNVIDAAVKSAAKDKVEVVLFVDQSVSNAAAAQPQIDRSRVKMTMEKVDGRWLASKVELP